MVHQLDRLVKWKLRGENRLVFEASHLRYVGNQSNVSVKWAVRKTGIVNRRHLAANDFIGTGSEKGCLTSPPHEVALLSNVLMNMGQLLPTGKPKFMTGSVFAESNSLPSF